MSIETVNDASHPSLESCASTLFQINSEIDEFQLALALMRHVEDEESSEYSKLNAEYCLCRLYGNYPRRLDPFLCHKVDLLGRSFLSGHNGIGEESVLKDSFHAEALKRRIATIIYIMLTNPLPLASKRAQDIALLDSMWNKIEAQNLYKTLTKEVDVQLGVDAEAQSESKDSESSFVDLSVQKTDAMAGLKEEEEEGIDSELMDTKSLSGAALTHTNLERFAQKCKEDPLILTDPLILHHWIQQLLVEINVKNTLNAQSARCATSLMKMIDFFWRTDVTMQSLIAPYIYDLMSLCLALKHMSAAKMLYRTLTEV